MTSVSYGGNVVKAIKVIKEALISWNNAIVGNIEQKIKALELEAEILESTKESKDLFRSKQLVNDLNSLYGMWESLWHQKSRV